MRKEARACVQVRLILPLRRKLRCRPRRPRGGVAVKFAEGVGESVTVGIAHSLRHLRQQTNTFLPTLATRNEKTTPPNP